MKHLSVPVQAPVAESPGRYENWLSAFDALSVQFLVLDAERDARLLQSVRTHPDWTVDFSDGESFLFARAGA
jgi:hypothetical protein